MIKKIISGIIGMFPKKNRMEFVKFNVSLVSIPREHREIFLKFINNLYFEKLESFSTAKDDHEKLRRINKAEQILEIYNIVNTVNINEDQQAKLNIEKHEKSKRRSENFLFW